MKHPLWLEEVPRRRPRPPMAHFYVALASVLVALAATLILLALLLWKGF